MHPQPSKQPPLLPNHNLKTFRIHTSTQISTRTTAILTHLHPTPPNAGAGAGAKPVIVCLTAPAKAASKLITIAEIAKRELKGKGLECFQYCALGSEVVEVPREGLGRGKGGLRREGRVPGQGWKRGGEVGEEEEEEEAEEEEAFETMDAVAVKGPGGLKKRKVPVLTVWLARGVVRELKGMYG
ncbi:hypothetical protein B0A50_05677 [Salinomyces thailandicus]|uniref:DNA/RNA-binding protein Alba-like domain-containing protein n=1 Tax=Salinomyces thailandicus TaxID=706561 RepID=A0A4V5N3R4_9PEZI|nr:hypothetical protein B0A50_05677 [Salinomyces thailandica]